ncbi:MAG: hypothetical protein MUD10_04340 [Candidatus Pacebacteria bacterium]|jgi:hypothetical protein|nr:hypothetical protein [Candidatus Paceibacterota bacterium]
MAMENIQKSLKKVYSVLKFTDEEAESALGDLAALQQAAVANELLKTLTQEEADQIGAMDQKTDEERKAVMEQIAKTHAADKNFKQAAQAVAKQVLDEHIAYLKTRGDEGQKVEIAKILAGLE